jgi:hypothetical protein
MQIRDLGYRMKKNSDPGWKKIRIRDKYTGSATLSAAMTKRLTLLPLKPLFLYFFWAVAGQVSLTPYGTGTRQQLLRLQGIALETCTLFF